MFSKPRGTVDVFSTELDKLLIIEDSIREIAKRYNIKEIRTPIFEHSELFKRGVGETSDVVSKEIYQFTDKGNRELALRPEGTAGVARAYVEEKLYAPEVINSKYYYVGPMFRYERPQAGRQRQFNQFGVEIFGRKTFDTDIEGINIAVDLLKLVGITDIKVIINSLGKNTEREKYKQHLVSEVEKFSSELCSDCQERLHKNPLRILDCKVDHNNEKVQNLSNISEFYGEETKSNFENIKVGLEKLDIDFEVDVRMVRGLDYYSNTIFEVQYNGLAILGGGRYDELVQQLGGPSTPAFGFAIGLERLASIITNSAKSNPDLIVIPKTAEDLIDSLVVANKLRNCGLAVERSDHTASMKSTFKLIDKLGGVDQVIVENGSMKLKITKTREIIELDLDEIAKRY